jgi:hypothetical protein
MSDKAEEVRTNLLKQAEACDTLGSPFTAMVCRVAADVLETGSTVGKAMLNWPGVPRDDVLALRFCGALHALVLAGADDELAALYPPHPADDTALRRVIPAALERHAVHILETLKSAPQTNEVARSGMLLPGVLTIARETGLPLAVFEMGSSAGLNQLFDRFHYQYDGAAWGDQSSLVRLAPEVRGAAPPLDGDLKIVSRHGGDISPIDVSDPKARLRLLSYIWPDQALRQQRVKAAIGMAVAAKIAVEKIDGLTLVRERLGKTERGVTKALVNTIMWQYMPESVRREIETEMATIGAAASRDAPLAWLRMEPLDTKQPHATLMLTLWPGGETRHLAKCDYHGRWIEWIG